MNREIELIWWKVFITESVCLQQIATYKINVEVGPFDMKM